MRSCTVFWVYRQSVAEVVRFLRWIGHVEHISGSDWVSVYINVEVVGRKVRAGAGRLGENL